VAGSPKRRERRGLDPHPWRDDPARRALRHEPFADGNTVALRHGANSERTIEPVAAELAGRLLDLAREPETPVGYLASPEYLPAVGAWASVEAECVLYRRWFDEHGLFDEEGKPRPGLSNWDRTESRAAKLRQRLGLDPLSRARLGRDVGAASLDLALLMSEHDDGDDDGDR
jgi:hypothetical protein